MKEINLKYINNIRDLGGYKTNDGKTVKNNRLIRSSVLWKLEDEDISTLVDTLHVDKVIDLRNLDERESSPDIEIPGVENIHLPIFPQNENDALSRIDDELKGLSFTRKLEHFYDTIEGFNVFSLMNMNYIMFISDEHCLKQFRVLIDYLLKEDNVHAILYHCAGGKDRAGVASFLILALLGVDEETLKYDYMVTDKYVRREFDGAAERARAYSDRPHLVEILDGTINVHEEYIDGMINYMKEKEGDILLYIKKYFSITDEEISILRDKYLD
ncbi:MAG: tyrosine-protein phosphatase [Coprobacillus sp.]|nr:tyrosine-protein phosphatase [Coprobacillus sp.]